MGFQSKLHSVMESGTRSKAQELKFWLFSVTRAQVWCKSFTQVSKSELCGSTGGRVLQTLSASTLLLLTRSNSYDLPGAMGKHALRHMKCYISSGEGKGWLGCMDVLCRPGDCTAKPSWHLLKVAKLFTAIISLSPHSKKKVGHSTGHHFKGWLVLSVLSAPVPLEKMLLLCF